MYKVRIYWCIKDYAMIHRIQDSIGIPRGMTVNGETTAVVSSQALARLLTGQDKGYVQIRSKQIIEE